MSIAESKLESMGLSLPDPAQPVANYVRALRVVNRPQPHAVDESGLRQALVQQDIIVAVPRLED